MRLRQSMINALKKSEERYKKLFNGASEAIFIHDFDGNIVEANRVACEKLKYSKSKLLTMNINNITIKKDFLSNNNRSEEFDIEDKLFYETEFVDINGNLIAFETDSTIIEYKDSRYLMVMARDITERKKSEQQLIIYQQQLKSMAAKLSLVQEEERRKIAVDLHDYIGQNLAISKIKLQLALYENKNLPQINEVLVLINQTIPFIRNLTTSLSPTILYDLSFKSALEWLCEDIQKHYKHDVILYYEDSEDINLSNDVKIILFQSVRELLINSVKHSKVNNAFITVHNSNGYFKVSVEDKGAGFDVDNLFRTFNSYSGFGLFSTKERIEFIGGEFSAESEIGKFTKISLKVPVQKS
jgi:PAS domain S-box-containing protein